MFNGILLVDKAKGWTSHDVVAKVRGILKNEAGKKVKVGHTGTLDPLATGLMVVVIGGYCKRAQEFSKLDKTYEVSMKLGFTSDTGDAEGQIIKNSDHEPFLEEVQQAAEQFIGVIRQTPPAYSAIKVGGKRAYQLAREGKEVNIEPRKVKIHFITGLEYTYPEVRFTCSVSSGTYIRSLVDDIGNVLGTGAYMSDLHRTKVGQFSIDAAQTIEVLSKKSISNELLQL
jgi:tRNA pseudouridine55 synthase